MNAITRIKSRIVSNASASIAKHNLSTILLTSASGMRYDVREWLSSAIWSGLRRHTVRATRVELAQKIIYLNQTGRSWSVCSLPRNKLVWWMCFNRLRRISCACCLCKISIGCHRICWSINPTDLFPFIPGIFRFIQFAMMWVYGFHWNVRIKFWERNKKQATTHYNERSQCRHECSGIRRSSAEFYLHWNFL